MSLELFYRCCEPFDGSGVAIDESENCQYECLAFEVSIFCQRTKNFLFPHVEVIFLVQRFQYRSREQLITTPLPLRG